MQTITASAPPLRIHKKRLTDALRNLPVDATKAVIVNYETSRALRAFGIYHGWKFVTKKHGNKIAFWRLL